MIKKIEITNFQSHKSTSIDLINGINVFCGESDNGKTAIIRAIKWVCENRPLGTDKLNSNWNEKFDKPMSVKIYLDDGNIVERIRTKDRNGYNYTENGELVELNATGTDVPQKITDILNLNDVNFQYQMDQPYLISMSSGEASRYLNNIIHLDSVDKMLSVADITKRHLNSEKKIIEKDIKEYSSKVESLLWIDEANSIQKRIDKYNELINSKQYDISFLEKTIDFYKIYENDAIYLGAQIELVEDIESIEIPDSFDLETSIASFEECSKNIIDFTDQNKIIEDIESIVIPDCSDIEKSIRDYESLIEKINELNSMKERLEKELPDICPLCGSVIRSE